MTREIDGEEVIIASVSPNMSRVVAEKHYKKYGTDRQLAIIDAIAKEHLENGLYLEYKVNLGNEEPRELKMTMVHWDELLSRL
ncbi:MAG: hypothetical protein ACFFFG_17725 [Candidatus Thorarchaeota archaeon]